MGQLEPNSIGQDIYFQCKGKNVLNLHLTCWTMVEQYMIVFSNYHSNGEESKVNRVPCQNQVEKKKKKRNLSVSIQSGLKYMHWSNFQK